MKVKLDPSAYMPERAHPADAGLDLRSPENIMVPARGSCIVETGIHVEYPPDMWACLKAKVG